MSYRALIYACSLLVIGCSGTPVAAQAEAIGKCHAFTEDSLRLACYDSATGHKVSSAPDQDSTVEALPISRQGEQWLYSDEESQLDGRKDVWLRVNSDNTQPNQIGMPEKATLWVRCMENSTNVFLTFNDYTTDNQTIRYRLGNGDMQTIWMEVINGGDGIGIWSGGSAIPFIKEIFGKDRLILGYDSYSSNNLEFAFDVSGLRARIDPLAEACRWRP